MTKLWEIVNDLQMEKKDDGFRQKNHMVNAGRRRRVGQVRAFGTSKGADEGWDKRGRGRAKKNFEPPSSVVGKEYKTGDWVVHKGSSYRIEEKDPDGEHYWVIAKSGASRGYLMKVHGKNLQSDPNAPDRLNR
jgi:hypothetical protein